MKFKCYLKERRSWILFVLFLDALILFVAFLDPAIPVMPMLYIVFLSAILFVLFFVYRYQRETKFFQSIHNWEHHLDITTIVEPDSPFEKMVAQQLINQTDYLKQIASENRFALEQEKDDLLSWIHEVKTPLTTMRLMIDRIEDGKLKESIHYEWLRIHHLLDQQLHQRRLPFMENDLFIEEIALKEILIQEIKALQSWCMQKGIGFQIDIQVPSVLSDAKWLSFILRQLLTNAIKYSSDSDIIVTSSIRNGQTILEIQDFGRGISARDLPRIFDRGFTSTTHHGDHAATGMGLYLTKKAAELLFIHIDVQSQMNEGATFTLTFPRRNEISEITGV